MSVICTFITISHLYVKVHAKTAITIPCIHNEHLFYAVKELTPNKEGTVEMETNPFYLSVVPAVQEEKGLERSGEMRYMNVGLVD